MRGRKHRRERIARKHGDEPAVGVHGLDQRVEDGAHDLRQHLGPVLAVRHQRRGHGAEAGHVHEQRGGIELAGRFARGVFFQDEG